MIKKEKFVLRMTKHFQIGTATIHEYTRAKNDGQRNTVVNMLSTSVVEARY